MPTGPANGLTGNNLIKHLSDAINKSSQYKEILEMKIQSFDLVLLNSIQFQTSLGFATKKYRTKNWKCLWLVEDIKQGFSKRLNIIKPRIIINLVTNASKIKEKVQLEIDNYYRTNNQTCLIMKGTHPSCWSFSIYKRIK